MYPSRFNEITLVIILNEGKRQMLEHPEDSKDQRCVKEIKPAT